MPRQHTITYGSLNEWVAEARKNVEGGLYHRDPYGTDVRTWDDVYSLARDGWTRHEASAVSVAEQTITDVERTMDLDAWHMRYDVQGCEPDVASFLSGEPENMVDVYMHPSPSTGRVVTIVASIGASGAVSGDTFIRRGGVIASLCIALERLGVNTEVWLDGSTSAGLNQDAKSTDTVARQRCLFKSANDSLDVSRLLFAVAHPAILRSVKWAAGSSMPTETFRSLANGGGCPVNAAHDMPEGTIYMPALMSNQDIPHAPAALREYLTELGVIENV